MLSRETTSLIVQSQAEVMRSVLWMKLSETDCEQGCSDNDDMNKRDVHTMHIGFCIARIKDLFVCKISIVSYFNHDLEWNNVLWELILKSYSNIIVQ